MLLHNDCDIFKFNIVQIVPAVNWFASYGSEEDDENNSKYEGVNKENQLYSFSCQD